MGRIHLSPPDVGDDEENALVRALRSGWVAPLGPEVDAFEREIAERADRQHAVALSSGTAALHLGLLALGVRPGDVVVTATMTFAATANAVLYVGAEPIFIDCDPLTGCIDPQLLDDELTALAEQGRRVGAVIPVDLLGRVADYTAILPIASRHAVPVLADAAESLGAHHRGRPAGSFGEAAVFSFNGNKVITTSGGGMLVTDDQALADRVRYLATQAREPAAHYEHRELGYNYRLSNLLAAVGRAQLGRLDAMIERRREVRARYRALIAGVEGLTLFHDDDDADDNNWLTAILIDPSLTWSANDLRLALESHNIESRPLWKPMHLQPLYEGCRARLSGASEMLFERGLALPSGSALDAEALERVCSVVENFLRDRGAL